MKITGRDIIDLGFPPGPHIPKMIERARLLPPDADLRAALEDLAPPPTLPLKDPKQVCIIAGANSLDELDNIDRVTDTLRELSRTPVVKAVAALPDACPAGPLGTIPVGGVAASTAIHPGMHSADICCSVAISVYPRSVSPKDLLERIHAATHFGPGGRDDTTMPRDVAQLVTEDPLLNYDIAEHHFMTQGDGNHFAFVGTLKSDGRPALVTHHGSRGLGAKLYKVGMRMAEKHCRKVSPDTLKMNTWIEPDTHEEEAYWRALQIVRRWTKANHFALHGATGFAAVDRFWNEHNFVFRKSDGLFYHAKGATPAFKRWASDATDLTLIPLNMAQPVLITRGLDNPASLGFSPHGAGRNMSRSEHRRRKLGDLEAETAGLDVRFYCGVPDLTELPSGYKDADDIRRQIEKFGLAEIVDEVEPYGCIMAGDWESNAPWRKK
jgi:tRNA-splicing ligase RtcB